MGKTIVVIVLVVLTILATGTYFIFFRGGNPYACGSSELTSKLPVNFGNLQSIKVTSEQCSKGDVQVRGMFPKVTAYGATNYKYENGNGTYSLTVAKFANSNDAMDFVNYFKSQNAYGVQLSIQEFGQNKVVWALKSGGVFYGAFWKSGSDVVVISNYGDEGLDSGLAIDLLSKFPSDNDISVS